MATRVVEAYEEDGFYVIGYRDSTTHHPVKGCLFIKESERKEDENGEPYWVSRYIDILDKNYPKLSEVLYDIYQSGTNINPRYLIRNGRAPKLHYYPAHLMFKTLAEIRETESRRFIHFAQNQHAFESLKLKLRKQLSKHGVEI